MNVADTTDVGRLMAEIGRAAKAAARILAGASTDAKNTALRLAATAMRDGRAALLDANQRDVIAAEQAGVSKPMVNRLRLTEARVESTAKGLEDIAGLPDPVGRVMAEWTRPNGLQLSRVRTPLGVIGVIYESRPNVTADAGGLCLKAGNASILRGGSESLHSSLAIAGCLGSGLVAAGLPKTAIQLVPTTDRAAVGAMLAMHETIDVIVPRGGRSLVERIRAESRVPLFMHLEGLCHTYVDGSADPEMARKIVVNSKMRRPEICGATETLLVDRRLSNSLLPLLVQDLIEAGCEVRGDVTVQGLDAKVRAATEADWDTEYLDAIIAVRVVDGVTGALDHIAAHNSQHTEAIVAEDPAVQTAFINGLDGAIVMVNTSTQFADGAEFGMGAEIGISTGKLHARGPVGVEELTTFRTIVRGTGQCRP